MNLDVEPDTGPPPNSSVTVPIVPVARKALYKEAVSPELQAVPEASHATAITPAINGAAIEVPLATD